MKSKKIVVREVSPDLHLITPELHQVSPELISKNGKMQNAVPFPCRLKVSPELGISPAGCFSLRIAKRHILGFRLKKKANGRPRYVYVYVYLVREYLHQHVTITSLCQHRQQKKHLKSKPCAWGIFKCLSFLNMFFRLWKTSEHTHTTRF